MPLIRERSKDQSSAIRRKSLYRDHFRDGTGEQKKYSAVSKKLPTFLLAVTPDVFPQTRQISRAVRKKVDRATKLNDVYKINLLLSMC